MQRCKREVVEEIVDAKSRRVKKRARVGVQKWQVCVRVHPQLVWRHEIMMNDCECEEVEVVKIEIVEVQMLKYQGIQASRKLGI